MDVFVFDLVVDTLIGPMSPPARTSLFLAGILGFVGVALGALGAHGRLHDSLVAAGQLESWRTAVLYHLVHTVALLALAGWSQGWPKARWTSGCWILGILLFSGSIYGLSLGGPRFLGPVTPLGGLAFLAGWASLAWNALRLPKA